MNVETWAERPLKGRSPFETERIWSSSDAPGPDRCEDGVARRDAHPSARVLQGVQLGPHAEVGVVPGSAAGLEHARLEVRVVEALSLDREEARPLGASEHGRSGVVRRRAGHRPGAGKLEGGQQTDQVRPYSGPREQQVIRGRAGRLRSAGAVPAPIVCDDAEEPGSQ